MVRRALQFYSALYTTYYEIWKRENTQFPMNSIFNHEPKKKEDRDEKREDFYNYLLMNMSRGTMFVELYIRLRVLKEKDWDSLADGVKWAERMFPCFKRVRMHGGDPLGDVGNLSASAFRRMRAVGKLRVGKVYGYTGWTEDMGYISIHNPNKDARKYTVTLDREFGLVPGSGPFSVSSPVQQMMDGMPKEAAFGDTLSFDLKPGEIRVLEFHAVGDTPFLGKLSVCEQ